MQPTTLSGGPAAIAKPNAPEVTQCEPADAAADDGSNPMTLDFDDRYIEKYWKALALMKALPDSDPRSFKQQADVHCAYLMGVTTSLINDPTFTIPYWNWDHPDGMAMPDMFNIKDSPFFNQNRDQRHLPPTVIELSYDGPNQENNMSNDEKVRQNLSVMYREMVGNAKTREMFLGSPYRAGDDEPTKKSAGSIERQPHGPIHNLGNPPPNTLRYEDMGNFYSAGRDPIFYAHHANVDRSWSIWKTLARKNRDFKDKDFLNAYFYFYDENAQLVKIYVRDCLDTKKMGYDYQPMDMPWLKSRPTRRGHGHQRGHGHAETTATPSLNFPKSLGDQTIRTNLPRAVKSRSKTEKEDEEEVLIIEVESKRDVYSKFDVFVNDEDDVPTKENRVKAEYAGSFVNVPHKHKHSANGNLMTTTIKFGLTDLIEDLGADDDDGIDITFVPRTGTESVVIKDVRIEFLD
ncbi:Polyphenol oxidase chloroplastic [Bienertia sinuspersici]